MTTLQRSSSNIIIVATAKLNCLDKKFDWFFAVNKSFPLKNQSDILNTLTELSQSSGVVIDLCGVNEKSNQSVKEKDQLIDLQKGPSFSNPHFLKRT